MTELAYYITKNNDEAVLVTPKNEAIYFENEDDAKAFMREYVAPNIQKEARIVRCIMFYDGGYRYWKDYVREYGRGKYGNSEVH